MHGSDERVALKAVRKIYDRQVGARHDAEGQHSGRGGRRGCGGGLRSEGGPGPEVSMFSLLAGLFRYIFSKTEVHLLILGLDHAGKTTLLEQSKGIFGKVQGIPPQRIIPTIGLNVGKLDIEGCFVLLWDLGGQVRMRSIWDKYYADAHGVIFVVDAADVARFEEAKLAFSSIIEHGDLMAVPVLLFANKQDLPGALSADDVSATFEIQRILTHQTRVQPCSALTCNGIETGVRWLVQEAKKIARKLD